MLVPVNKVICKLKVFSNVIVDITISGRSSVFSQSCVEVPASLSDVGLAVGALHLVKLLPTVRETKLLSGDKKNEPSNAVFLVLACNYYFFVFVFRVRH